MFDKLANVETRYNELTEQMAQPEVATDYVRFQQLARELRELEDVVNSYRAYRSAQQQLAEARALLESGSDAELRALAAEEVQTQQAELERLEAELRLLLLPKDPNDEKNVIIEVRQGEGGDEAGLFAADLYRMYTRYAELRNWKVDIINSTENSAGGIKELIFEVHGDGAYSRLKYEGGVHRVQRVPATEARGRIHTSTATVAVLPEVEDTNVELSESDYRVDVYRSGGHGGQGVNTTDSAVRIVYKAGTPDEIVVTCQDGRSQIKNKAAALSVLRARLYAQQEEKRRRELGDTRLAQVGTGERAEKIRTYNFPQDRVTDHRIGQNFSNLPGMLAGDLDRVIDQLTVVDNAQRLEAAQGVAMTRAELEAFISAMPKVELHLHLEGSIRPATLLAIAKRNHVTLPADTVAGVEQLFQYDSFPAFIGTFMTLVKALCRGEDFEQIAYELGTSLADQNVRYAEVMISPSQYFNRQMDLDEVVQGTAAGFARVGRERGLRVNLVFDYGRQFSLEDAWRVLEAAVRNRRHGVVGWSIGGDELHFPPEPFAPIFVAARQAGLRTMAHAGEVVGPESVWGAVDALGCERIGHGITSIQDLRLLQHLRERGVTLDISPTSNLRTGACVNPDAHPIRQLFEAGVLITVNSDDPTFFATTLTDELRLVAEQYGFSAPELAQLTLNAASAAFLPPHERDALVQQLRAELG